MRYVFFFPYLPPSGVSSLFVRMARAMIAFGSRVRLVDFADGAMAREDRGLELTEYRRDGRIEIGADETLELQAELPGKLRRFLQGAFLQLKFLSGDWWRRHGGLSGLIQPVSSTRFSFLAASSCRS